MGMDGRVVRGAWGARLHSGGSLNVIIPAFAATVILFGLAVPALRESSLHKKRALTPLQCYLLCTVIQYIDNSASTTGQDIENPGAIDARTDSKQTPKKTKVKPTFLEPVDSQPDTKII